MNIFFKCPAGTPSTWPSPQCTSTEKHTNSTAFRSIRCVCVTFLPPGEQVSGGGVLVIFRGLEPQLEGEEPRILIGRNR